MMITVILFSLVQLKNIEQKSPQCIFRSVIFSNAKLQPSKLDKRFKRIHGGTETENDKETLKAKKVH